LIDVNVGDCTNYYLQTNQNILGEKGNLIKAKVSLIMSKNKYYQMLVKVGNILYGNNEDLPEHFTPSVVGDINFSPLTC
jgi:hypothetical protein